MDGSAHFDKNIKLGHQFSWPESCQKIDVLNGIYEESFELLMDWQQLLYLLLEGQWNLGPIIETNAST